MSLIEIFELKEKNISYVARRESCKDIQSCYVPLCHDTVDGAIKKPIMLGNITVVDVMATDWYISEI